MGTCPDQAKINKEDQEKRVSKLQWYLYSRPSLLASSISFHKLEGHLSTKTPASSFSLWIFRSIVQVARDQLSALKLRQYLMHGIT